MGSGVPGQFGLILLFEGLAPGVLEVFRFDLVAHAGVGLGDCTARCGTPGSPMRARRRVLPEAAVFEDLADDLTLAGFDESDDLHGPAALGAQQRVDLVDALDQHRPTLADFSTVGVRLGVGLRLVVLVLIALLGTEAACLVGVVAVVTDEVFALVGDVLGEFGEEVEGIEDLIIANHTAEQVVACGFGEAMGPVLLGVVDHLPSPGNAEQAGEAERGAGHVLGEAFETVAVGGGDADGAIDAEAGVSPEADLVDDGVIDAPGIEQQAEHVIFPDAAERFVGEVDGDGVESAVGGEHAVGDQAVNVGMEVHERAEGLDGQGAAGRGVVSQHAGHKGYGSPCGFF